ncbi:MAG: YciI family protein [Gammaproteobacteria bacterium]
MYYAIIAEDADGSLNARQASRPDHLQRLEALREDGKLLLAGPHPAIDTPDPGRAGFSGSLIIAEFPSLNEARDWAEDDPYRKAGVYRRVTVKPFIKVLP